MPPKVFITAQQLEQDSWAFARQLHRAGVEVDGIVGITRGGVQISVYIQEALSVLQKKSIRYNTVEASSYTGIGKAGGVLLRHVDPLVDQVNAGDTLLVLDDIFDRGRTLDVVKKTLEMRLQPFDVNIMVAALYYKPENNEVDITPDHHYKIMPASDWLVFPHELMGLSADELAQKGFELE